jgi:hypothetical protein
MDNKKSIEDYKVEELARALDIAGRFLSIFQSVQGQLVVKHLAPSADYVCSHTHDDETRRCFREGYSQGLEAGIKCFPESINVFSVRDILDAVYGMEHRALLLPQQTTKCAARRSYHIHQKPGGGG